jgi:mRNA (guanine-N7-)-methyltransferase
VIAILSYQQRASNWSLIDELPSPLLLQATNFHKFYEERKNPAKFPMAHNALYNMKVLNRNGSISDQEWDVSRLYIALKFCKVAESNVDLGDEDVGEDEMRE